MSEHLKMEEKFPNIVIVINATHVKSLKDNVLLTQKDIKINTSNTNIDFIFIASFCNADSKNL